MLSPEERERIIVDESLRCEIRKAVESSPQPLKPGAQVLAALNKPLGLWLLTTVLVGVVTWSYSLAAGSIQQRIENSAAIERLNTQAAIRLEVALERLKTAKTSEDFSKMLFTLLYDSGELRLSESLADRSTFSIVWEAAEREKGAPDERTRSALRLLTELSDAFTRLSREKSDEEFRSLDAEIRDKMAQLDKL